MTRQQAIVQLDRIRTLPKTNCADATLQGKKTSHTRNENSTPVTAKRKANDEERSEVMTKKRAKEGSNSKASNAVEAVCVSPTTGRQFTTAVDLGNEITMDEDDLTSENNPAKRVEVRRDYERLVKETDKNSGQAVEKKK